MIEHEELLDKYRQLAELYAPAKATREYLEEYKKSLLALLMKDAEKAGFTSAVTQEREGRSRPEYHRLLDELRQAVHEEEKLRYHLKAAEIEFEMWRTRSANERFERRAYGS